MDFIMPFDLARQVTDKAKDYASSTMMHHVFVEHQQGSIHVKWNPPALGWVCVNVDGEVTQNSSASYGGVIRDSFGCWVGSCSKYIGRCIVEVAEMWAVLEGIKFAISKGFNRIELQSDNINIVSKLNGLGRIKGATNGLLRSITMLNSDDVVLRFMHIFQEANRCVDTMAKMSSPHDLEPHFFQDCPTAMVNLLDFDSPGAFSSRACVL